MTIGIKIILESFLVIISIIGGGITIYTYWRNSGLKRAEWLYSLYEKFFEQSYYKRMRQIIDYGREEDISKLKKGIIEDSEDELIEALVDYLNFFEFIASLWKLRQLSVKEISMVFEYYILRISDYDFLMQFLKDQGFEQLPGLIYELKTLKGS